MIKQTWNLELKDKHTIRLTHPYWYGKCRLWIDNQLVEEKSLLLGSGTPHYFVLDGYPCELGLVKNGLTFSYYLIVDGRLISSNEAKDRGQPRNKQLQAILAELNYWQNLAELTGLKYVGVPGYPRPWCHRLIGKSNGYWTVIRYGKIMNSQKAVVTVLVSYSPPFDPAGLKCQLKNDLALKHLLKQKKLSEDSFGIQDKFIWILSPYQPKKETVNQVAHKAIDFVNIVSSYAHLFEGGQCEGKACPAPEKQPLQLVFINGWPYWLCPTCLAGIPTESKKAERSYKTAPTHLGRGFWAGSIGSVLGSLLWAAIIIVLNKIDAIFAAGILVGIVKLMDWVGAKRTIWSIFIAAGFTLASVVLGTYLAGLWHVLFRLIHPLSVELLVKVWVSLFKDIRLLGLPLMFGLIGIVPYLWLIWLERRRYLSQIFQPKTEIIEGFTEPSQEKLSDLFREAPLAEAGLDLFRQR